MSALLGVPVDAAYHLVLALTNVLTPVLGGLAAIAGIIALTAAVRLLVMPLSFRALRGQATAARLAPELARLRDRYGKQPERLQREMTALYAREGTSVFAGFTPLLAQWPVFSVLYLLFRSSSVAGGQNLLLSRDFLGVPLGGHWLSGAALFSGHGAVFVGVLAVLAATCWLSARVARQMQATLQATAAEVPAGAKKPRPAALGAGPGAAPPAALGVLGKVLPYLTVVIAAFAPLAAAVYLVVSTGWSAAERWAFTRSRRSRRANELAAGRDQRLRSWTVPLDSSGLRFPPIRRLGPGDLNRCVALSVDRGWSPERAKWALLLAAAEPFGVDAPDGRGLAGAVVLTRYGTELASAGMMLVAARYARRGLGRALMEHLLAEAAGATVTLFATDMGRPLYEKLGFRPVRRSVSFAGRFRPGPGSGAPGNSKKPAAGASPGAGRVAVEADMPAILKVDKAAFGADRSQLLGRLPGFVDRMLVLEAEDGITGYAASWRAHVTSTVLGPVVAPDPAAAIALVTGLATAAGTPVRIDLDPDRPELPAWAHAHGLEPVARTTVMALRAGQPYGAPERIYAPVSLALT